MHLLSTALRLLSSMRRNFAMTEYELEDLLTSTMSASVDIFAIYISLLVAYLVAAYLAGDRLTSAQATTISILFLVASAVMTWGCVTYIGRAIPLADALEVINPDRRYGSQPIVQYAVLLVQILGIITCLKIMWDVRHGKDE
jgi:cellobiose-specific phosphotransferase system component IIC